MGVTDTSGALLEKLYYNTSGLCRSYDATVTPQSPLSHIIKCSDRRERQEGTNARGVLPSAKTAPDGRCHKAS